jgi:hypothetical protein
VTALLAACDADRGATADREGDDIVVNGDDEPAQLSIVTTVDGRPPGHNRSPGAPPVAGQPASPTDPPWASRAVAEITGRSARGATDDRMRLARHSPVAASPPPPPNLGLKP